MKTTTLTTPTHEILIIELTDFLRESIKEDSSPFTEVKCDWKELGFISDIKESEVEPLVYSFYKAGIYGKVFKDYFLNKTEFHLDHKNTALESFLSLLETKVYWENPIEPAGIGIRESDNLITNNTSFFVPHFIKD